MILFYVLLFVVGIGFVIWGVKRWRKDSVGEKILDLILSPIFGFSSSLGLVLFGLLLIFLSLMKFIYGEDWGIQQ